MFVSMWMTQDLVTIGPGAALAEAAERMAQHRIRRLPVVEAGKAGARLVGIVSATDILRASPPELNPFSAVAREAMADYANKRHQAAATVGHIMHAQPLTTTPDAPIEAAARLMRDHKIGALPVVRQDTLVGLVTESDIFRAFVALFDSPQGARITFDLSKGEDPYPFVAELIIRHGLRLHSFTSCLHHEKPVCVVQVAGPEARLDALVEQVWSSHHRVLNVVRVGQPAAGQA